MNDEEIIIDEEEYKSIPEASEEKTEEKTTEEVKAEDENSEAAIEDTEKVKETSFDKKVIKVLKSLPKLYLYLAIIVVACVLFLVIFLNIPSKKAERLSVRGNVLYSEEKYDKALSKFEKGLKCNPVNEKAAYGLVLTKMALNDPEGAKASYLEVVESLKKEGEKKGSFEFLLKNSEAWIDFSLLSPELFSEEADYNNLIFFYENLKKPSSLKASLANASFEWGMNLSSDFSKLSLIEDKFYDCLEYSDFASSYFPEVTAKIDEVIDCYKSEENFDKAREVLERFKKAYESRYQEILENIGRSEAISEIKKELLSEVYNVFNPYYEAHHSEDLKTLVHENDPLFGLMIENLDTMMLLDGSANANAVAFSRADTKYCYAPEKFTSDYTGVACALYPYGDITVGEDGNESGSYYFYFGEYKNGKRDGYGIIFAKTDVSSYVAFEGNFKEDVPNGFGVAYENNMYAHTSLSEIRKATYGEYKDGLENGEMITVAVLNEHPDTSFKGTYVAENGVVAPLEGEPINYGIVTDTPAGYSLVAIIPSTDAGYDYFLPVYLKDGSRLSALGF